MRNIYLLDSTLRDGGYINDWAFGESTIRGYCRKIAQTGIEICEIGFIKGDVYDPDRSMFPDTDCCRNVILPKDRKMKYVGMLDMSAPVPMERIKPCDGTSIDGIRVIFKKDKIREAYEYCDYIQKQGYFISVNVVGTDLYTDEEFIRTIELFNELHPFALSIVDSFGLIKRKHFLRLVYLADHNLAEGIVLGYHAHNNLQQAFGNAESLVEMNLKRDLIIDACVFGMGRGAGNLNLELFADYMNENYDSGYKIGPMLEIIDEYLNRIYKVRSWGYSLPLYLSATTGCHPNYAIYLSEKDTLTVKSFRELLSGIPGEDKARFSKEKAERYYKEYQANYVDDKEALKELSQEAEGRTVLMLAPGRSLQENWQEIAQFIKERNALVYAVNFRGGEIRADYIFSSNMRRFRDIQGRTDSKCIVTSNMKECIQKDYVVNYASYTSRNPEIMDNAGLMMLRLLAAIGVKEVWVAGMDGYSDQRQAVYCNPGLEYDFSKEANVRNQLIASDLKEIRETMDIHFLTPTCYLV